MFMVGVALPFSIASRRARGESFGRMLAHAVCRAADAHRAGRSSCDRRAGRRPTSRSRTCWRRSASATSSCSCSPGRGHACSGPRRSLILAGYWAAFALYPLPPHGLRHHDASACRRTGRITLTGFAQHWDKNTNLAARLRRVVPQPVPARAPFVVQRRRLPDAELRPVAGDDDLRADGRRRCCGARARIGETSPRAGAGWASPGSRSASPLDLARHLPDRQAHLDAVVGGVQRRLESR